MNKQKIVLPANVFDALELSALVFGGIGTGCLSDVDKNGNDIPSCIVGHGLFLDGYVDQHGYYAERTIVPKQSPVLDALVKAFPALDEEIQAQKDMALDNGSIYHCIISDIETVNDSTVSNYATNERVTLTWKQWTKRMGVVRGN